MENQVNYFGFELALALLKQGKAIAREGWNGKNMFAVMSPGAKQLSFENIWTPVFKEYAKESMGGKMDIRPTLMLKTAQDDIAYWTPSCSDLLAEDWYEV